MEASGAGLLLDNDLREKILALVALSALFLFVTALLFGVYTVTLRRANERKAAQWRRLESFWDPRLLDVLAGNRPPEDLSGQITRPERLHFLDYLMRLTLRVRGRERTLLMEMAAPFVPTLLVRVRDGDVTQRARALRTLGIFGVELHSDVIIGALDDPSPLVAMVAARALARQEHPQHLRPVLDHLDRFVQWSRNFLCSMLVAVGPEASPELRRTLADRNRPGRIRAIAAETLRELKDLPAAETAVAVLPEGNDSNLMAACLRLIGAVGGPASRDAVVPLCDSPNEAVRGAAFAALSRVGNVFDHDRLRLGMMDPSMWVALHAARGLRDGGDHRWLRDLARTNHPRSPLARQIISERR